MPFRKGISGNCNGRPAGTENKFTRAVKEVIAEAFGELQKDPKVNLITWGKENPTEFYKLAAKLIPVQLEGNLDMAIQWNEVKRYEGKEVQEAIVIPEDNSKSDGSFALLAT